MAKPHPDVLTSPLQTFDDGRLTDSKCQTVDFSHTIIYMTSNLGNREIEGAGDAGEKDMGLHKVAQLADEQDLSPAEKREIVEHAIKRPFRPEVCDRFSETLVFEPLGKKEIARIARRELNTPRDQRQQERRIYLKVSPSAALLAEKGFSPQEGARRMRQTIEHEVANPIAARIAQK